MSKSFSCLCLFVFAVTLEARAEDDWPQQLGPNRNGISDATGLIDSWPENGLKELWRVPGGVGMSGLAIRRERLITMVQNEGEQHVICVEAGTGQPIWKTPVAPAYRNGQGDGPRATPTIAGEMVFAFTGEGILCALSFANGEILWSHNTLEEHGGEPADYGMACSPLVADERVMVTIGAPEATVVAYETKTGKPAWTAGQEDAAGYSSPALLNVGGRQQVVVFTGGSVIGVAPQNGNVLWRFPYKTDFDCNIATPLMFEEQVFISAAENHGCVLLKFLPDGDRFRATEVWSSQGPKSVLRNEWQTSILIDGYLYGFDNVGSAGPVTHLTCVNAATGQRAWQQTRFGKGNLIAGDGKLFISTTKGELVVATVSPEAYKEIGRTPLLDATRQAPALASGLLYLRDGREIVCVDVRKKQ